MKKTAIILVLLVGSTILLSARGNEKRNDNNRGDNRESQKEHMEDFLEDAEIITISGKLVLVNDELPTIIDSGVTYTLMAPWFDLEDVELTNGMKITLKGAEITRRLNWDGKEKNLIVTEITVNGKTTEIDHEEGFGHMGGKMGARGRMGNN